MVMTIEPGLYLSDAMLDVLKIIAGGQDPKGVADFLEKVKPVYEKYKNIGIRIEDDLLITEEGNRILSVNVPNKVQDIESMMRKKSSFRF